MDKKRVVVWGTGVVGSMVIAEIVDHPVFELVGVGVSNPAKVGVDAGTICGIAPTGVIATDSVEELIALKPDALVHYGPTAQYADDNIRVMSAFLRAGHRRLLDGDDAVGVAGDEADPGQLASTRSPRPARRAARPASPPASTRASPTTSSR